MEEKLINEILSTKERAIRNLLNCTESPIERIFVLELLKALEDAISNPVIDNSFPNTIIDGYTFIPDAIIQGEDVQLTNRLIGIEIKYTSLSLHLTDSERLQRYQRDGTPLKRRIQKIGLSPSKSLIYQGLNFYPQYKVQIGEKSFRLDFAFILGEVDNEVSTTIKKVGIECDGYKYHSSPEQFSKDRVRNRAMNLEDWTIIQYAGSEIYYGNIDFKKEFAKIFSLLGFSEYGFKGELSGYKFRNNPF